MLSIDLNADVGEGMPDDALLMCIITSANIAFGYHAGNLDIIKKTAALAAKNNVSIGAHPGFDDKLHFGRKEIQLSTNQINDLISEQLFLLQSVLDENGQSLKHVKPHGALYNMSAKDPALAKTVAEAIYAFNPSLKLFGLSGSHSTQEAKIIGLQTVSEVFADRTYQLDGSLTPRHLEGAIIENKNIALQQVLKIITEKKVQTRQGNLIDVNAESICLHGDNMHALTFAKEIANYLFKNNIQIKAV